MQQADLLACVLLLLAIPISVVLVVSLAKMLEHRSRSSPAVRYLLALVAHAVLAVFFLRLTAGHLLSRIWWGHEIVLLTALAAVLSAPGLRKRVLEAGVSGIDIPTSASPYRGADRVGSGSSGGGNPAKVSRTRRAQRIKSRTYASIADP